MTSGGRSTLSDRVNGPKGSNPPPRQRNMAGWRPLLFGAILILTVVAGFQYKARSNPGIEKPQFRNTPPLILNVYVNDPRIEVNALVKVATELTSPGITGSAFASVTIKVVSHRSFPHGTIIVTSNRPASSASREIFIPHEYAAGDDERYSFYYNLPGGSRSLRQGGGYSFPVVYYSLPPVIEQDRGSTFGHLPLVGSNDLRPDYGFPPPLLGERKPGTDALSDITFAPSPKRNYFTLPLKGSQFRAPNGGPATLFWVPRKFSFTQRLVTALGGRAISELSSEQIDYMSPPAKLVGSDYVWHGVGIQPIFKMTDPDSADSRSTAAFVSGIAFGVAGAAALAIVQELPRNLPLPADVPTWLSMATLRSRFKRPRTGTAGTPRPPAPD